LNKDTETVFSIISLAVSELNEELEYDHLNELHNETPIFEGELALDSLSLVSLIVDIEDKISDAYDCDVVLASDKAMSMLNSPYRNIGSLVAFVLDEIQTSTKQAS